MSYWRQMTNFMPSKGASLPARMAENYELPVFNTSQLGKLCVGPHVPECNPPSLSNTVSPHETLVAKGRFQADTQEDFESLLLVTTYMFSNKARRTSRTQQRKRPIQPVGKDKEPELE